MVDKNLSLTRGQVLVVFPSSLPGVSDLSEHVLC